MSLAVLFSVVTRNGIVGVPGPILVALAMQLLELIGSGSWVHTLRLVPKGARLKLHTICVRHAGKRVRGRAMTGPAR